MKPKHWWIIGIVAFIVLAPADAIAFVHSIITFVQGLLAGFHLH